MATEACCQHFSKCSLHALPLFLCALLLSSTHISGEKREGQRTTPELVLERSTDLGETWQVHAQPHSPAAPSPVLLRIQHTESPVIEIPLCAAMSPSLLVKAWYRSASLFALSWTTGSQDCGSQPTDELQIFVSEEIAVKRINMSQYRSAWMDYVWPQSKSQSDSEGNMDEDAMDSADHGSPSNALGQGIRKGLAELKQEAERQQAVEEQQQALLRQQSQAGASRVIVRQTGQNSSTVASRNSRSNLRSRKKGSKSAESTSASASASAAR